MPERLRRLNETFLQLPIYFVTACTHKREPCLNNLDIHQLSKVLREKDVPSPHWQKGFFDHILRSADSYSEKWEYVRENPVRARLVTVWNDWPFSGEIFDLEFRRNEA